MAQSPEQNTEQPSGALGLFIAPLTEVTGLGKKNPAIGGGLAIGADDGIALGFRFLYLLEPGGGSVNTLELGVFLRWYMRGEFANSGPFLQFTGGALLLAVKEAVSVPAYTGAFSAGLGFGWRFPLGKSWFLEPAVRVGYPFIYGAGVSIALRI